MKLDIGSVIRFSYQHAHVDASTDGKFKECLILHNLWNNKVHCIDLKRLSPAQRETLEAVLDPEQRGPHRLPLVNDIRRRMDAAQLVQNPVAFYSRFLKPFLRGTDAYRQYHPARMSGITVVKGATIATGKPPVRNPLFPPKPVPPSLPGQATTVKGLQTPGTPIDIMARSQQRALTRPSMAAPKPPKLPSRGKVIKGKIQRPR